jgi:hypothetical protein
VPALTAHASNIDVPGHDIVVVASRPQKKAREFKKKE